MHRPSRRALLGAGATFLASLAGCLGPVHEFGSTETTNTTTTTPTTETTESPTPSYDVDVNSISVVPELVAFDSPDSTSTVGDRDEQFVVADVASADHYGPGFEEFELVYDGEVFHPVTGEENGRYYRQWPRSGGKYTPGASGTLVFRLPKPIESESVALGWPGGSYELDSNSVSKLTRPPAEFLVHGVSAELRDDGLANVDVEIEVRNISSTAGTFVGALDRVGPNVAYTPEEAVVFEVPAKDTATWSHTFELPLPASDEYSRASFILDWRRGSMGTVVDLREGES
ncbi:hypothetical protein [Haloferax sp. DFSO60]|uniref:hypothetical protein n=1 Tax=Haloferax sp. DFSO60 TaxID=3388652 RepID=UPI00397AB109